MHHDNPSPLLLCGMCEDQAEIAQEDPETYGTAPEVKPATVLDKWPQPVCAEHDAWLESLGLDLAALEEEDPDLKALGRELGKAVRAVGMAVGARSCTEIGCLVVTYRRHSDSQVVATHVHMDSDDQLQGALEQVNVAFGAKVPGAPQAPEEMTGDGTT